MIQASPGGLAFLLLAGLVAGAVNAVAGGGSLLVFPALLAVGFPPLAANVTNSVAQWPGYLGIVAGRPRTSCRASAGGSCATSRGRGARVAPSAACCC